jgi:hypothetical protein
MVTEGVWGCSLPPDSDADPVLHGKPCQAKLSIIDAKNKASVAGIK